jgi:fatty-acid peroxygenase
LALQEHPAERQILLDGDERDLEAFAQQVRHFYPFFPFIGGRVLQPFGWNGHRFERGEWVLLDIYGTNHDQRLWEDAESFRPERASVARASPIGLRPKSWPALRLLRVPRLARSS